MKNAFYLTLKALLVLKIFKLLLSNFCHVEKQLDQKDKVNFKIYDVTTWLTNNCNTYIDQYLKKYRHSAVKFGQLIEHNMRDTFLGKSYTNYGGDTILRPFSKKSESSISLDQQFKVLSSLFIVRQVEGYQNILKLSCRPLAFTSYKAF